MHLNPDEIKTVRYYVLTDIPGTYTIETEIYTEEDGGYIFYKKLCSEMTVKRESKTDNTISDPHGKLGQVSICIL